jgi:hypothetical protein
MKTQATFVLFAILFGFSIIVKAASTGQLLGQIIEKESGKPVPFATITIENRMEKIQLTANEFGHYYANHVPTGLYQIRVVYNRKTFFLNKVRIFDSYATVVDLVVSSEESLPPEIEIERKEPLLTTVSPADINLTNNTLNQRTQSVGDVLSMQPGVDIVDGRLFIKGSDQVRFFIDGSPVMGQAIVGRTW